MGCRLFGNSSTFVSRSTVTASSVMPKALLSRLSEIGTILLSEVRKNVGYDQPRDPPTQYDIRPGIDKSGNRAATLAAEQRRAIWIGVLKIGRNCPGIENDLIAVDQHRHATLGGERDRILVGESPRDSFER